MKQISAELAAHLAQETTTLATCWKVTRRDSQVLGFTTHDANVVLDSVTYLAASGFTPTAVATSAGLSVDNLDVEGMLDADAITEADVLAGKYDYAELEVFLVNYTDLAQGKLILRTGWLGEVTTQGGSFIAEVRGLAQQLNTTIGEVYSPSCRAKLGDTRCKVSMAAYTHTGSITSVTSRSVFTDSARAEANNIFVMGKITFTSGANNGISMEIKQFADGQFTLALPMPHAVQVGDGYSVQEGCDKTFGTCSARFNNAVNFRGEPHVPGIDRILETAGTRSDW